MGKTFRDVFAGTSATFKHEVLTNSHDYFLEGGHKLGESFKAFIATMDDFLNPSIKIEEPKKIIHLIQSFEAFGNSNIGTPAGIAIKKILTEFWRKLQTAIEDAGMKPLPDLQLKAVPEDAIYQKRLIDQKIAVGLAKLDVPPEGWARGEG